MEMALVALLDDLLREDDRGKMSARLLTGVKKYHISPTLVALHWLPICFHIDFKVLMLIYKALNGLGLDA